MINQLSSEMLHQEVMGTRYDEFLVRHRLPRPLSMAYEAVCFALNENDPIFYWCGFVTDA